MAKLREREVVRRTAEYVKKKLAGDSSGHDWFHCYRVARIGGDIARCEGADIYVVQLSGWLHDIADYKLHRGDEEMGPRLAGEWLRKLRVDSETISHIQECIRFSAFKGKNTPVVIPTLEGRCLFDADKLDATGAIGIARCFAFGGRYGNVMYDPSIPANPDISEEEYKKARSTQINHFYEKLLLLKDLMKTKTGKRMAQPRHRFMERFFSIETMVLPITPFGL